MADCSNAVEFSHELYRMCCTEDDGHGAGCYTCPFNNASRHTCPFDREVTQEDVDVVQKWSDEHPDPKPKTYADDFFEKFPSAIKINRRPAVCRARLYGTPCRLAHMKIIDRSGKECLVCWNEVMPE